MCNNKLFLKKNILPVICFCFIIFLQGCVSTSFFNTPNDVKKMQGTMYMQNGEIRKGLITVSLEHDLPSDNFIDLIPENDTVPTKINFADIKYYTIGNDTYVPKIVDLFLKGDYHYLFLKRLTTANDKMQFYELDQKYKSNDAGEETSYYFISFPNFSRYEAIDINSIKLIPEFDIKMSNYLSDCPAIAEKIKTKQQGYYYTFMSLRDKKLEVIKRIVKEYNECSDK